MWQICGYVPQTLDNPQELIETAAQLSTSFFIETFIHAKEKVYKYSSHLVFLIIQGRTDVMYHYTSLAVLTTSKKH